MTLARVWCQVPLEIPRDQPLAPRYQTMFTFVVLTIAITSMQMSLDLLGAEPGYTQCAHTQCAHCPHCRAPDGPP